MLDALIDKTKAEACRTAEANALRLKSGVTGLINYDFANSKGFADAIAAIETDGGSSVFKESGEIAMHTGANVYSITIPISDDTKAHYHVTTKAKKLWKKENGVWVERNGIAFDADKATSTKTYMILGGITAYPIEVAPATAGETSRAGGTQNCFVIADHDFYHEKIILEAQNVNVAVGNGTITISGVSSFGFERSGYGATHEYTVIGWD